VVIVLRQTFFGPVGVIWKNQNTGANVFFGVNVISFD